jgi:hypothetical protein
MIDIIVCRLHKGHLSRQDQVQGEVALRTPPCAEWRPVPLGYDWKTIAGQLATDLAIRAGHRNRLLLTRAISTDDLVVYEATTQKEG